VPEGRDVSYPERIVPGEAEPGVDALHLKRYAFALPFCIDRRVLDAGCGVGYGAARVAARAASVIGIDVSEDAIAYAKTHYGAPNLSFQTMDAAALAFDDESFEAVCSFETIEHVEDAERVVSEFARVLASDGALVISTPQVARTTTSPANPHHHVEFSRADFEVLLRRHFDSVELYGQRRIQTARHRVVQHLDVLGLRRRFPLLRRASLVLGTTPTADLTADDIVISRDDLDRATEIVAVCR
jgi:SAM-dependent methyltransferase